MTGLVKRIAGGALRLADRAFCHLGAYKELSRKADEITAVNKALQILLSPLGGDGPLAKWVTHTPFFVLKLCGSRSGRRKFFAESTLM